MNLTLPYPPGSIFIYALVDPETGANRYIGKAGSLQKRLHEHRRDQSSTWRTHWIKSLLAKGLQPEIVVLEVLPKDADWQAAERRWIATGRSLGWNLTNCTSGGDGVRDLSAESRQKIIRALTGKSPSVATRAKQRAAKLGGKLSDATRAKMSAYRLGKKLRPMSEARRQSYRKLTPEQVRELRQLRVDGWTFWPLARRYGIGLATTQRIVSGESYGSVA